MTLQSGRLREGASLTHLEDSSNEGLDTSSLTGDDLVSLVVTCEV